MPMKSRKAGTDIKEFHTGPTYAKTRARFGAKDADRQAVAVALNSARKDPKMAKHEHGMGGEGGISPRKAMASGMTHEGGNFGVEPFHEMNGGTGMHPDHAAHTGMKPDLEEHEGATPPAIMHTKGHHPAQAAPRHGHTHPGGHGHHHKYEHGKV